MKFLPIPPPSPPPNKKKIQKGIYLGYFTLKNIFNKKIFFYKNIFGRSLKWAKMFGPTYGG